MLKTIGMTLGAITVLGMIYFVVFILFMTNYPGEKYHASQTIGGIEIKMQFQHAHPFLKEFDKTAWVTMNGITEEIELFKDPGGRAWVNIFQFEDGIIIQDWGPKVFEVEAQSGNVESFWVESAEGWANNFAGKFIFKKRKIIYVPKEKDRAYVSEIIKGG